MDDIKKVRRIVEMVGVQLVSLAISAIVAKLFGAWAILLYYIPLVIIATMVYLWFILQERKKEETGDEFSAENGELARTFDVPVSTQKMANN